ncbi:hypothetical protein D3C84_1141150 [compost metagenome]
MAVQHQRLDRWVGRGLAAGLGQFLAQTMAEGVDRCAIEADQGQFVVAGVVDQAVHLGSLIVGEGSEPGVLHIEGGAIGCAE